MGGTGARPPPLRPADRLAGLRLQDAVQRHGRTLQTSHTAVLMDSGCNPLHANADDFFGRLFATGSST